MPVDTRSSFVAVRLVPERKAALSALASRHGLSASGLLALLIDTVLRDNHLTSDAADRPGVREVTGRVTLRLRRGDKRRLDERAHARNMKSATYLALLVRSHVRADPPLPSADLDAVKQVVNRLAAIDRHLARVDLAAAQLDKEDLENLMKVVEIRVGEARCAVADVVRANLISWESGDV